MTHDYDGIEQHPKYSPAELAYVDVFGAKTQALVATLPSAIGSPDTAVYSIACYNHHWSEKPDFFDVTTASNVSLADATRMFMAGEQPQGQRWIDECHGFSCGGGCMPH